MRRSSEGEGRGEAAPTMLATGMLLLLLLPLALAAGAAATGAARVATGSKSGGQEAEPDKFSRPLQQLSTDQACLAALRSAATGCRGSPQTSLCDACRVAAGVAAGCSRGAVRDYCSTLVSGRSPCSNCGLSSSRLP